MADETFEQVKARAAKVLGNPAVFPKFDVPEKLRTAYYNSGAAFEKSIDGLQGVISDMEATTSAVLNAMRQGVALYDVQAFGLNPKSPDDKKKIETARDIMEGMFTDSMEAWDDNLTHMRELDKHIVQMGKYKSPKK